MNPELSHPPDLTSVTLAVLAGGAGTRMGMPKSLIEIAGRPILAWLLDNFSWPGPTLLVTAPATRNPPAADLFDHRAVDPVDGNGPLQGILTALQHATTGWLAVVTVDMPKIDTPKISWLVNELRRRPELIGIMCRADAAKTEIEPFPAVFTRAATNLVADRVKNGMRAVHALCDAPQVAAVVVPQDWPPQTWLNLNHPEQLAAFQLDPSNPLS